MKGMQKIKRGTGFRGVLNYTLEDGRGEVIGGNMTGETPRELAAEFGQSRQIREDIEKPVWHNSLRLPEGEKLDPEKWATIADDYMKKMGFGELHQRAYIMHNDQAGQHLHIVASRVDLMGKIYLGQNENLKSTKIIAELEHKHGLTVTRSSQDPDTIQRKTITTGEKGQEIRTGEPPARKQLQAIIDQATADKPPFNEFVRRLHAAHVSVLPSGKTGAAQGVSFEIQGQALKGSDLGKSYAWKQLQTRIEFDQSQHQALIDRLRQEPSAAVWNERTKIREQAQANRAKLEKARAERAKMEAAVIVRMEKARAERAQARAEALEKQKPPKPPTVRELLDLSPADVLKTRPELADSFKLLAMTYAALVKANKREQIIKEVMSGLKDNFAMRIANGDIPKATRTMVVKEPVKDTKPTELKQKPKEAER